MSEIVGYETDVLLKDSDLTLRVLVVQDITYFYLDEKLIFTGDWSNNIYNLFLTIKEALDR